MLVFLEGRYQFLFLCCCCCSPLCSGFLNSYISDNTVLPLQMRLSQSLFLCRVVFIMVLIFDTCFLHACPAHFSFVNEICFLVLVCWKRSWSFWLCFFLHSPVWSPLYCLKILYRIFLLKTPSYILLFFFWEAMFLS